MSGTSVIWGARRLLSRALADRPSGASATWTIGGGCAPFAIQLPAASRSLLRLASVTAGQARQAAIAPPPSDTTCSTMAVVEAAPASLLSRTWLRSCPTSSTARSRPAPTSRPSLSAAFGITPLSACASVSARSAGRVRAEIRTSNCSSRAPRGARGRLPRGGSRVETSAMPRPACPFGEHSPR